MLYLSILKFLKRENHLTENIDELEDMNTETFLINKQINKQAKEQTSQ